MILIFVLLILTLESGFGPKWGFWAHKRINRLAVFRLPPEMQYFYKKHIDYLTENAVNPDRRRYAVVGEAERHFIDLDVYGDSALAILPKFWSAAVKKIGEDSLRKHGIVPWFIQSAAFQLTDAFKEKDTRRILRISADLGHYVADSNVPLHTTRNYNGQLTGQEGIHAFWESRLPELYVQDYDLWIGQAVYIDNLAETVWNSVNRAHLASDSVFLFEKHLSESFDPDKKFSYELRNNFLVRTYSQEFSEQYHNLLKGQVERQMKASVEMVGNLWFTCWINAGQPDLRKMKDFAPDEKEKKAEAAEQRSWLQRLLRIRSESDD
ncbi:zinc dependent phospholipase C family protein [Dyadobacter sp. CY345]|uniref:zinc dependent phospholipase C family protein n=1 Tax=Dyadobacter sp. CY345 TaxID=2909335 RepID=UPI001F324A25|nr:zinc dependent phospholipase C family protein [Dyadobacter sp. CY345]MCF2444173.1 zinc dependent phospholipase C family protein [Dyadobacter sp. CY345]